jgi:hypothetical protein
MKLGVGPFNGLLKSLFYSLLSGTGASPINPDPLTPPKSDALTTDKN